MGVGQCNDRRPPSLLLETTLGEPPHESIEHYAQLLQGSSTQGDKLRECCRFQKMSWATSQGARNKGDGRVLYEVLEVPVLLMGALICTTETLKHKKNKTLWHQQKSTSTGINTTTITPWGNDAVRGQLDLRRPARHHTTTTTSIIDTTAIPTTTTISIAKIISITMASSVLPL